MPFLIRYPNKRVGILYYGTGQGIGLYSRWASIALFHHAIVRLAAIRVGIKDFIDYLVLGDDIVIASETVYREYLILMGYLGVDISTRKSVLPTELSGCEFASKYIYKDGNISPLPAGNLFVRTIGRLFSLWDALLERRVALEQNSGVHTGPDFKDSFPLAKGAIGWEELRTLWGRWYLYRQVYEPSTPKSSSWEAPKG